MTTMADPASDTRHITAWPAMVCRRFGFSEPPFSIAPDPRFLFMSEPHREALAHLVYGARQGGLVLLTGEVGTGKTTLCRLFIEQLPEDCEVAFIFNPRLSDLDLLATVCDEFRIPRPAAAGTKALIDRINAWLLERHSDGKTALLIVDEAQNLSVDVLEQMRLLTNLETNSAKLLQIVIIGQPELRELLNRPVLRQFSQRITARYHLPPLTRSETRYYVQHRLQIVGGDPTIFEEGALRTLFRVTGGIPRLINVVCDRALLGAAAGGQTAVSPRILAQAATEVFGRQPARPVLGSRRLARVAAAGVVLAIGAATMAALETTPGVGERIGAAWSALTAPAAGEGSGAAPVRSAGAGAPAGASEPVPESALAAENQPIPPDNSSTATGAGTHAGSDVAASLDPETAAAASKAADDILAALVALHEADRIPAAKPDVPPDATPFPADREQVSRKQAFEALFEAWRLPRPPGNLEPCAHVAAFGLRCREGWTDVDSLTRLNRPAVLRLDGPAGRTFATVTALAEGGATMIVDGDRDVWPLAALDAQWSGDFTLFWQAPEGYVAPVGVGYRGPVTPWVRRSLAWIQGLPEPEPNGPDFDQQLRREVLAFQAANGLTADGIVGPMTIMRLNSAVAGAPRLAD